MVRWWILFVMVLSYSLNYLDRVAVLVFLPFIRADMGLTHAVAGMAASIFFFAYSSCLLIMGPVADRVKSKNLLYLATAVYSTATLFTGMMQNVWQFLVLRGLLGWGESSQQPPLFRCLGEWFPANEKGRAMACFGLSWGMVPGLLPPLLTTLYVAFGHWRPVFYVLFGLGILACIAYATVFWGTPDEARQKGKIKEEEFKYIKEGIVAISAESNYKVRLKDQIKVLLGDVYFWIWAVCFFCLMALMWGGNSWIPSYLYEQHHFSIKSMGLIAATPYVFAGIGMLTGGWLVDRFFRGRVKYLVTISILMCIPVLIFLAHMESGNTFLCVSSLALLGFFGYLPQTVMLTVLQERYPKEVQGAANGFGLGLGMFGAFVGPIVMGFLVVKTEAGISYANSFMFLSAVCLVGSIFAALVSEKKAEYNFTESSDVQPAAAGNID